MYVNLFKRLLDIALSLVALVLLFPLMVVVAILIKLFDYGPIIFSQIRVGRDGGSFTIYKFRSMPLKTGDIPSNRIGDVKLIWLGRMIRRTNIDELPQLYNILLGDMSFVGPRPSIRSQTDLVELRLQNGALRCRPGLTGLAQVSSFNGMTALQKAALDGTYSQSITFLGDLKIFLRTVGYLFTPPPVY